MRKSFDTLALVARELLGEDARSGALYVFVGKQLLRPPFSSADTARATSARTYPSKQLQVRKRNTEPMS